MTVDMPVLAHGDVHAWTGLVPAARPAEIALALSAEERSRAGRYRFPEDRLRYEFAHAFLRSVLARYLPCPPGEIRFGRNRFGKPFVAGAGSRRPPEFSLSHAGGVILVGVCNGGCIGVDVEQIRPMDDLLGIAQSEFAPREYASLLAQPPAAQERAFFRCWTRKEAYVKALGRGLSIPLNSFDTVEEPGGRAGASAWPPLRIMDLQVPGGYLAAVAAEPEFDRLSCFGCQ